MKEYTEPTVKVIEFDARDIITTSGGSKGKDTSTPEGGNILGIDSFVDLGADVNRL